MLVPFAVDPEAIQEDPADPLLAESLLRDLVEQWERYGHLIYGLKADADEHLLRTVDGLPRYLKDMWYRALRHNRYTELDFDWPVPQDCSNAAEVDSKCTPVPELKCLLLSSARATAAGLAASDFSKPSPSGAIDMARYQYTARADAFAKACALSTKRIELGDLTIDVWKERFEGLAKTAAHIVIVDRYALNDLIFTRAKRRQDSGIETICRKLASLNVDAAVDVFSARMDSHGDESKYRQVLQDLFRDVPKGSLRAARFYLAENEHFKKKSHGRYLRFGQTVCRIDTGLNILEGSTVGHNCDFSVHTRESADTDTVEDYLRRNCLGKPEEWL